MKILIAGGTGFIGQALVKHFATNNTVTVLSRSNQKVAATFTEHQVNSLSWAELSLEDIEKQDVIINLCGEAAADRPWSDSRKQALLDSRITPTKTLAQLCARSQKKPALFNANAIGVYGLQTSLPDQLPPALDETTTIDFAKEPDFLATIGRRWQLAAQDAVDAGVRVVFCRFGLVLGDGGALTKLRIPYLLCLGGPIGDGMQPFCWVAMTDIIHAIEFLIAKPNISGAVNIVSPNTVTQKEFATTYAKALNRPAFFPNFAFIIKLVFGQMGEEALLKGQHAYPKVLLDNSFEFQDNELEEALDHILKPQQ